MLIATLPPQIGVLSGTNLNSKVEVRDHVSCLLDGLLKFVRTMYIPVGPMAHEVLGDDVGRDRSAGPELGDRAVV